MPQDFVLRTHYRRNDTYTYQILLDATREQADTIANRATDHRRTCTAHPAERHGKFPARDVGDVLTGAELDELPVGSAAVCVDQRATTEGVGALVRHRVGWIGSDEWVERLARPQIVAPGARFRILHIGSGR